jgi:cellulose synthase/poly-beta-1,6-N-acetylglucosamine synthase-like glycosyltransferase
MLYIKNRKNFFSYPESNQKLWVSFCVPAYNEEKTIEDTLKHINDLDYPYIKEIIVVNDKSSDNTRKIVERLKKKYKKLKLINNKVNLGKGGGMNVALKIAKGDLFAVVDADSYPDKDSIRKMVGFFNEDRVGAVTCVIVARNENKFFEKIQAIEYRVIAFTRKLLDFVDAIWCTPGPLALYRKSALIDIGGFDTKNLTEDIEATWHLAANGWHRRMCLDTSVSSTVPTKFKPWFKQRRRWNVGGMQCIYKFRKSLGKQGMLGIFIVPFFILGTFLGLFGLTIFGYLTTTRIISKYLFTKYSIIAGTPIVTFKEFYITPNFLNYLGITLFIFSLIFTLLILNILKQKLLKRENLLIIPFYMIIYLTVYPFILVTAIWHMIRGKRIWR